MSIEGKTFSDTLRFGVDEWHEFPCSPCGRENRNVAAIKYCVECDENLCSTCLKDHNKFTRMRLHQITDNLSSRTGQRQDLPTQICDRHGGKLIDVYCTTHDVVGCSTCFNIEHGSCEGIQYIPDMTAGMQQSEEFSHIETKLKQLLARLDHITQQKQDDIKLLQQDMDKLLTEIQGLRKRVNDKLDEMEQTLVDEVKTKLGERARDVSKDLDVINNERTSLEKRQKSLQSSKRVNKTEQFVQLKMGQSLVQEHERIIKRISTGSNAVLQVLPNSNITTLLQTDDAALESISEILIRKSTTYDRDVNVRLPSDKRTCFIVDICLSFNGDVYLADHNNCRIKKLNESYTVTEHFYLPGISWGLCEVDNKRLAVTLYDKKKVLILSQNPMSLGGSFFVGDFCRGIDCHNGQLYVCCGGWRENGEGPGRIEVYSMGGELLRIYYQGASFPGYVHVSDRGDLLISMLTVRVSLHYGCMTTVSPTCRSRHYVSLYMFMYLSEETYLYLIAAVRVSLHYGCMITLSPTCRSRHYVSLYMFMYLSEETYLYLMLTVRVSLHYGCLTTVSPACRSTDYIIRGECPDYPTICCVLQAMCPTTLC